MGRHRVVCGLVAVFGTVALVTAACTSSPDTSTSAPSTGAVVVSGGAASGLGSGDGYLSDAAWRARQDDYLRFATSRPLSPGSTPSILAYAERSSREPGFTFDPSSVTPAAFADELAKVARLEDTSDFNVNDWLFLWYGHRDRLPADTVAALEQGIKGAKYWWTEPTPPGLVDSQYYWTENHQIIFLANEYAAGQAFPDVGFAVNGVAPTMTGRQHMEHARPLIEQWIDLRARFGFSEWLSDVYSMEDVKGLLLLAEWADDKALATKAAMALDVVFADMASNSIRSTYGSTHGRTYSKDKTSGFDEDTFSTQKLLFDTTTDPYPNVDNASLLATARRYRPPAVLPAIAGAPEVAVVRQRHGQPLDPSGPVTPDPAAPNGFAFDDPANLGVWWGMGAQFAWQLVPLSVDTIDRYDLWETANFARAKDLQPIVESTGIPQLQQLAVQLAPQLNTGLLSEVDTVTWRSPDVMLSTAQDWRPGVRSEQVQVQQATIDAGALVFTTHPAVGPPSSTRFSDTDWFTGNAANPRAAQIDNVGISIYAPQYPSGGPGPLQAFSYEPYTHAFFPQDRFDEVVQRGTWTIGRRGDGYVALYSWRPVRWSDRDPATLPGGHTQPYEVIADGGPDDVWLVEVGRAGDWSARGGFAGFVDAISAAPVEVTRLGPEPSDGFDVRYVSPTRGEVTFGWTKPLVVDGREVPLHGHPRDDSPWARIDAGSTRYAYRAGGATLDLDFDAGTRTAATG